MTTPQVAAIIALDEKRTPGEWVYSPERNTHDCCIHVKGATDKPYGYIEFGEGKGGIVGSSEWIWINDADAAFIAAAPKMVSIIRQQQAEIEALRKDAALTQQTQGEGHEQS